MSPRGPRHKDSKPGFSKRGPQVAGHLYAPQLSERFGLLPAAALLVALASVVAAAYGPFYSNPLVSDDLFHLYHYRQVLSLPLSEYLSFHPFAVFRPLFWLLESALYRLSGFNPATYHFAGLALHVAVSALVCALAFMLTRDRLLSALSAGVFALSYLHSEPLLLRISQVHVFGAFWALLTLITYIHARQRERRRAYLLSVVLFYVAIFSNQAVVGILFVCLFYDLVYPRAEESFGRRFFASCLRLAPCIPAVALSVAVYIYRSQLSRFTYVSNVVRNLVTLLSHPWYYFGPQGITDVFQRSSSALDLAKGLLEAPNALMIIALLLSAGVTGALFLWKIFRGEPLERLGCFFFLANYLPFISYYGPERRYFYLPMVGFSMVVSYWFLKVFRWSGSAPTQPSRRPTVLRLAGVLVLSLWVAYQVSFIRQAGQDYRTAGVMVSKALDDLDFYAPFAKGSRLYIKGLPRTVRYAIAFHPHFLQALLRFRLNDPTLTARWFWPEETFPPAPPGTRFFLYSDRRLLEVVGPVASQTTLKNRGPEPGPSEMGLPATHYVNGRRNRHEPLFSK